MQFVLNFRNCAIAIILLVGGYYCYRNVFADVDSKDVAALIRAHRRAPHSRQMILKRRILSVYDSARDHDTVARCLDSASIQTQALAIEIFAESVEQRAVPKLLEMLRDPTRDDLVKETLAAAFTSLRAEAAVPRLVELTDTSEGPGVRSAAHRTLRSLTGAGGQIKLSKATRQHWEIWLRNQKSSSAR